MDKGWEIPFRGMVEQSLAGVYVIQDEIYQYVNATFAAMIGYSSAEMTGMHLRDSVVPEAVEVVMRNYHLRISGQQPSIRFRIQGRHKQGHAVELEVHGARLLFRGRPAVIGVGINITEQVLHEREVHASRERLRALAAHLQRVREEHRAYLARNLHDVVGGLLTSMKLATQRLERTLLSESMGGRQAGEITAELQDLIQETLHTVRQLSEDLRPSVLDHLGLLSALHAMARPFSARTGVSCEVYPSELALNLSCLRATEVYRICQEALTNVTRHARAQQVKIHLACLHGYLTVLIVDDGIGFVVEGALNGFGLTSMSERARALGGQLTITSWPLQGTQIDLRVPLDAFND